MTPKAVPLSLFSIRLLADLYSDALVADALGDDTLVAGMVRFEQALARVQGQLGVIPGAAAEAIDAALEGAAPDVATLAAGTVSAGVPVPALVAALRKTVGEPAAGWLHWGATSQDVIDTAIVLQVRACLDICEARLGALIDTLQVKSDAEAGRVMAGRTRSQIATPITLGYRIAQWAQPLIDAENGLADLRRIVLRVQFGGASGINSAIAPHGSAVADALAADLGLEPGPSWHVNRSGMLALGAWLQGITAGLAKMAGDLVLLGRSEIGEVTAGTGGGSSTMPQKNNPVQAEAVLTLNQIAATAQAGLGAAAAPAEERDGARWPLEWHFLPQMLIATGAALRHAGDLVSTLWANDARLRDTLAANPELMAEAASFALARAGVSRADAKDLVARAAAGDLPFAEALAQASDVAIDWSAALDPATVIAPAREMSERIFARRRTR